MEVEYFCTATGEDVIAEFLSSLPRKDLGKVLRTIGLLEELGMDLREPNAKHLEGPIWELRVRFSTNVHRILYFVQNQNTVVLLHGFTKKSNKTPPEEFAIAKKRLAEFRKRTAQDD